MAEGGGAILNADSNEDPGVIVQLLGEERGHGLVAVKSFVKGQTLFREKVTLQAHMTELYTTHFSFSGIQINE